jgi:hypothetical protein
LASAVAKGFVIRGRFDRCDGTAEGGATMSDAQLIKIWPTIILRKKFPDHDRVKPGLLEFVQGYMAAHPEGRRANENRDLYESQYDIFKEHARSDANVRALADFLGQSFVEVASAANLGAWKRDGIDPQTLQVNITASWFINYLSQGNVDPHLHGNGAWSCVYYLQMGALSDPKDGATFFICPLNKSDSDDLGASYAREASRFFSAVEGYALFFPSSLIHGSFPYSGDQSRIIFSANARVDKQESAA